VALRALDPPIPERVISLVWRRGRTLSPAADRFISLAAEAFGRLDERRVAFEPSTRTRRTPARAGV